MGLEQGGGTDHRVSRAMTVGSGQEKISPRTPITRMQDPGIVFSKKIFGRILLIIMFLFYLNLFMALAILIIGPAIVYPELKGEDVSFLFGLSNIGGGAAAVYYCILSTIIVLSFMKAFRQDGYQLWFLLKKEFTRSEPDGGHEASRGVMRSIDGRTTGGFGGEREGKIERSEHPHYLFDQDGRIVNSPSIFSPYQNNSFILVALFFFSVYAFEFVFDIVVQDILGIVRHIPRSLTDIPVWYDLYRLPEAPVVEELTDRLLLIGIALYFIHNWGTRRPPSATDVAPQRERMDARSVYDHYDPQHQDQPYPGHGQFPEPTHPYASLGKPGEPDSLPKFVYSLFERKNWKYIVGGGFDLDRQAFMVLMFSTLVFSISHIGWDWTKLIPTFLGGIMLGILFLKKGLHASIMLHFAINSFGTPYFVLGEPFVMDVILWSIYLGSIPFGLYYLTHYLGHFRRWVEGLDLDRHTPEFSREITATGGVMLLFFVLVGLVFMGIGMEEEGSVERDNHRYLELSDGDYEIYDAGEFSVGERVNGTISIENTGGEIEFMVTNFVLKEDWKRNGTIPEGDSHFIHLAADKEADHDIGRFTYSHTMEQDDHVFIIVNMKNLTRCSLTYTTVKEGGDSDLSNIGLLTTCGLMVIGLAVVGLGCVYTSNYYTFGRIQMPGSQPPPFPPPPRITHPLPGENNIPGGYPYQGAGHGPPQEFPDPEAPYGPQYPVPPPYHPHSAYQQEGYPHPAYQQTESPGLYDGYGSPAKFNRQPPSSAQPPPPPSLPQYPPPIPYQHYPQYPHLIQDDAERSPSSPPQKRDIKERYDIPSSHVDHRLTFGDEEHEDDRDDQNTGGEGS